MIYSKDPISVVLDYSDEMINMRVNRRIESIHRKCLRKEEYRKKIHRAYSDWFNYGGRYRRKGNHKNLDGYDNTFIG